MGKGTLNFELLTGVEVTICRVIQQLQNIKIEGHLLLPKITWFLSYLKLKSEPYLELFTWIIHTAKVRGCTHQILNLRVMQCVYT